MIEEGQYSVIQSSCKTGNHTAARINKLIQIYKRHQITKFNQELSPRSYLIKL